VSALYTLLLGAVFYKGNADLMAVARTTTQTLEQMRVDHRLISLL
jgi:hypothetical protein